MLLPPLSCLTSLVVVGWVACQKRKAAPRFGLGLTKKHVLTIHQLRCKQSWQQTKLTTNKVDGQQSWWRTKLMMNKVDNRQSWWQTKLAKKHVLTIHKLYRKKKVDNKQSWRWTKLAMNNVDNEQSWQLTKLTTDKEVGEETCVDNSSAVQTKSTRVSSWAQPEMCQPDFFCNTTKLLGRSYLVSKIKPLLKTSLLSMATISEIWVCGTRTSLPIQTWFVTCLFYLLHYCDTFRANLG